MTKLKETIHFENEEGICKICVELGRQSAQKEFIEMIDELANSLCPKDDWHCNICHEQKEILRRLKSKLKSATTNEEKEQ
jgi:hypothetical protein